MKQPIILLLILTTVFSLYGQTKSGETPAPDFRRIQLGINVSPDICFRTLRNTDGGSMGDFIVKSRDDLESIKVGYTVGLNACFNINKYIGIETGVQYSDKGYQLALTEFAEIQPTTTGPQKAKFVYHFQYIDIPLKVNLTVGKKKVRFFTCVGVITNIFIQETLITYLFYSDHTDKNVNPPTFDCNRVNISPMVSVGIDYRINKRMNLRVEPTFRYGMLKIIDAPVTGYLYSAGLNISYYVGL